MSMIATHGAALLPRMTKRDFTLCKAVLLVALIVLGHMATHLEAGEGGDHAFSTWKSAFCDDVAGDRRV